MKKLHRFFKPILLLSTALFAIPKLAHADILPDLSDIGAAILNPLAIGLPYLWGWIGGIFLTMAGALADVMFKYNLEVMDDKFGLIEAGFGTMLSFANLGFVVALIIMAFATILQIGNLSAQRLLPKLIISAVLVNFSLLIAGLLLDLSHVLTMFFDFNDVGTKIAEGFNLAQFFTEPDLFDSALIPLTSTWFAMVITAVFNALFTWGIFIVMLAVAGMLLVRYVTIVILLILMPVVWVAAVLPFGPLQSAGRDWWKNFLGQVFFLPTLALFLSIAVQGAAGISAGLGATLASKDAQQALANGDAFSFGDLLPLFMQFFVIGGLIVGGLIAASRTGGKAGSIGMSIAKKTKKGILTSSAFVGGYAYRATGAKDVERKLTGGASNMIMKNRALNWIPGSQTVANALAKRSSIDSELAKEKKLGFGNIKGEPALDALAARGVKSNNNAEKVQFLKTFADANALDKLGTFTKDKNGNDVVDEKPTMAKIAPLIAAIKAENPGVPAGKIPELKALAETFPRLANQITGQSARQALSGANVKNLSDATLSDSGLVAMLSQSSLNSIAREGDDKAIAVNTALIESLEQVANQVGGALSKDPVIGQLKTLTTELGDAIKAEREGASQAEKDSAAQKIQEITGKRATLIQQINRSGLTAEESAAVSRIEGVAYAVGSLTAQSKKPKTKPAASAPEASGDNDGANPES